MNIEAVKQALDSQDFYEVCQQYRHSWVGADEFEALKQWILQVCAEQVEEPIAWAGLEKDDMPDGADPMYDHDFFIKGMVWANNKLLEKNAATKAAKEGA
jgi:hypothetical protein